LLLKIKDGAAVNKVYGGEALCHKWWMETSVSDEERVKK